MKKKTYEPSRDKSEFHYQDYIEIREHLNAAQLTRHFLSCNLRILTSTHLMWMKSLPFGLDYEPTNGKEI